MRCLLVDDEFLVALDMQSILESAGAAEVLSFSSQGPALNAAAGEGRIDVAVLDFKLGADATSLPIAAVLAAKKIPFVFLTGMSRDSEHLRGHPTVPLVQKPFSAESLLAALRRALEQAIS